MSIFVLEVIVLAAVACLAARLCLLQMSCWNALIVAVLTSCFSFVPQAGWWLGTAAFAYLLQMKTREPWVDCLWITILSRPIAWFVTLGLSTLFTSV